MSNSVNIVAPPTQNAPQHTAISSSASSNSAAASSKPLVGSSSTPISPRIIVDPLAGVITQFLSASGQLESQIPSAAVVAYLRAGLTPQGYAKPIPNAQQSNNSNPNTDSNTGDGIVA